MRAPLLAACYYFSEVFGWVITRVPTCRIGELVLMRGGTAFCERWAGLSRYRPSPPV